MLKVKNLIKNTPSKLHHIHQRKAVLYIFAYRGVYIFAFPLILLIVCFILFNGQEMAFKTIAL